MKRLLLVLAVVMLCGLPVLAQDVPKAEIYGGYLLIHDENVTTNGIMAALEGNVMPRLGIVAEFGFGAQTNKDLVPGDSIKLRAYQYLFGPRFSLLRTDKVRIFAHALFGGDTRSADATVNGTFWRDGSTSFFAMAYGGGVDVAANKWLSIRLAQVDIEITRWNTGTNNTWDNSLRYSGGLVFKLGSK